MSCGKDLFGEFQHPCHKAMWTNLSYVRAVSCFLLTDVPTWSKIYHKISAKLIWQSSLKMIIHENWYLKLYYLYQILRWHYFTCLSTVLECAQQLMLGLGLHCILSAFFCNWCRLVLQCSESIEITQQD